MSGTLIMLPLKLGARVAELSLRGATEILQRAAGLAGVRSEPSSAPEPPTAHAPPADAPAPVVEAEVVEPEIVDRGEPVDYDAPTVSEPDHVDAGEELVEEVAEPGAEDGAGAEVRVAEPWDGYQQLRAADVIERVPRASAEELAAIELYELSGRRRQTVIAAVERELARRG